MPWLSIQCRTQNTKARDPSYGQTAASFWRFFGARYAYKAVGEALEVIPRSLAHNCGAELSWCRTSEAAPIWKEPLSMCLPISPCKGADVVRAMTDLRARHATAGVHPSRLHRPFASTVSGLHEAMPPLASMVKLEKWPMSRPAERRTVRRDR